MIRRRFVPALTRLLTGAAAILPQVNHPGFRKLNNFISLPLSGPGAAAAVRMVVNHWAANIECTQKAIQHLVGIGMVEAISSGEQKLNHPVSVIRR